jgi:acyl-coenzyme A thioesterase PaaI-like protein
VQEEVATAADTSTEKEIVAEEVVGTTVTTETGSSGVIETVDTETGEATVDVTPGTTTSGGTLVGGSTSTSAGTAGGGVSEAVVATTQSTGPAETEAISFYERGRRSTILTSAQGIQDTVSGLLSDAGGSMLRQQRGLVGQGLIS